MKLITTILLGAAMSAAQAQTVYRCDNAYSHTPCAKATLIDVADQRSAAQRAEAERVARDERRLAADMHRERLADERAARPGGAASLSGHAPAKVTLVVPVRHPKRKPTAVKPLSTTEFIAYDPSSRTRRSN